MEHPDLYDYNVSVRWAQYIFSHKDQYLILDTETTGLGENDVIIQLGVIDLDGNHLIDTLVRPSHKKSISRQASAIHGIRTQDLYNAPTFEEVLVDTSPHFSTNKQFLIYNFEFDSRLLQQTLDQEGLHGKLNLRGDCIMKMYSQFVGEWNPFYNDYRRQKLPGATHGAIGDCMAALKVLQKMANAKPINISEGYRPKSFIYQGTEISLKETVIEKTTRTTIQGREQGKGTGFGGCLLLVLLVFVLALLLGMC